ncbi:hypothetical protein [Alishewanella aestuarii]|uniref:hypothetical protein n=1 Tax=Alishewanella aestuarii TaxID=453835 RepID=UPI001EE68AA7|nr:hypothetical protein [Alishewanella aestuarii]
MREQGMVLLSALLFLVVMLLMVSSNLYISQLSVKSAQAAQQQLQLDVQALQAHLLQLSGLDPELLPDPVSALPSCPGTYAAWSDASMQCELVLFETAEQHHQYPLYTRYGSMLLRKRLQIPEFAP